MATLIRWWESLIHWWDTANIGLPRLPHLTQAELASWVSAISTSAATIAALGLAVWEIRRAAAERRDREAAQARRVTITVPRRSRSVDITNYSDQPVHQPQIVSMGDPPPRVRLGGFERASDKSSSTAASSSTTEYAEVLPPGKTHRVLFDYLDADGQPTDGSAVAKHVDAENVTIAFTDTSGLRWRRTGSGEPIRLLLQPTPETE